MLQDSNDICKMSLKEQRQTCFARLISALRAAGYGGMVDDVMICVTELQRITLLWEELWTGVLMEHLDEMTKKEKMNSRAK
ncbi:unnamed protein product [Protopolystoma xenopodis]|uniref:Uncharacterized protein n=1 Tax=Protopolystoma xenopodis TaxID=117903 RepID=A0A448X9H9_9PLAT|nr:unnamed protein product [Protopolystoma xenopodis]